MQTTNLITDIASAIIFDWHFLSHIFLVATALLVILRVQQIEDYLVCNKHFMTGPKGNSEFCFPETSLKRTAKN